MTKWKRGQDPKEFLQVIRQQKTETRKLKGAAAAVLSYCVFPNVLLLRVYLYIIITGILLFLINVTSHIPLSRNNTYIQSGMRVRMRMGVVFAVVRDETKVVCRRGALMMIMMICWMCCAAYIVRFLRKKWKLSGPQKYQKKSMWNGIRMNFIPLALSKIENQDDDDETTIMFLLAIPSWLYISFMWQFRRCNNDVTQNTKIKP